MISKLLTSTIVGLLLPWVYFLFVNITPMNIYENGMLVREASMASGVFAFVELNGIKRSLMLYLKVFVILSVVTFCICTLHEMIKSRLEREL